MPSVTTRIDEDLCDGCGLCVRVCPSETLSLEGGKARVTGDRSLRCGHCAAVCPRGAVRVEGVEDPLEGLKSFRIGGTAPPGPESLAALMAARFSCRNFRVEPLPREILEDLVRIGTTAPSGTNSQKWTFTILPDRESVLELGRLTADFYAKVNTMARNPLLRFYSRLFAGDELGRYYREYYPMVRKALEEWRAEGRDRLFHGAPAAIVVGSLPGASCPGEDALLAAGWMTLAAQALGLGSCLIGYAVEAAGRDRRIREHLGLAEGEKVRAVLALGRPALPFRPGKARFAPVVRFFDGRAGRSGGGSPAGS